MKHILRCSACGAFSLRSACPACGKPTQTTWPAKYSTDDKYAALRRKAKAEGF